MSILTRIIGLLIALSVIVLLPVAVWFGSASRLIRANAIKSGLAEHGVYADIIPVTLSAIAARSDDPDNSLSRITDRLSDDDWRAIADTLVPPDWLQTRVETAIDLFFAYLDGDSGALERPVDISELRRRLTGVEGERAVEQILRAAPDCTAEEVRRVTAIASGGIDSAELPVCNPPEQLRATTRAGLVDVLNSTAAGAGEDNFTLLRVFGGEDAREGLAALRNAYRMVTSAALLLYLCPAALLALLVIFTVRSLKSFGRWFGWIGVVSGMITLIPLALLLLLIQENLPNSILENATTLDADTRLLLTRVTTGFLRAVLSAFSGAALGQAAALILGGLALLIVSVIAPKPRRAASGHVEIPAP